MPMNDSQYARALAAHRSGAADDDGMLDEAASIIEADLVTIAGLRAELAMATARIADLERRVDTLRASGATGGGV